MLDPRNIPMCSFEQVVHNGAIYLFGELFGTGGAHLRFVWRTGLGVFKRGGNLQDFVGHSPPKVVRRACLTKGFPVGPKVLVQGRIP